jgi:hypothetical protein
MNIKINSPLKLNSFEPMLEYSTARSNIAIGILSLFTLMCLRAQITSATNNVLAAKEIQGLDSQKKIAKFFNGSAVNNLLFYYAVGLTLFANAQDFTQKDFDFDSWCISELDSISNVNGRIIPEGQLSANPGTISTHRRGLMAQARGSCQTTPIFSPTAIISGGINPLTITMTGIVGAVRTSCQSLGIDLDQEIAKFSPLDTSNLSNDNKAILVAGCCIFGGGLENLTEFMDQESDLPEIRYEDAITVSDHPDNLLPIEASIVSTSRLRISRTKTPSPVGEIDGSTNPLAAAAAKQIKKFNEKLKTGKLAPNKNPKKAPLKESNPPAAKKTKPKRKAKED